MTVYTNYPDVTSRGITIDDLVARAARTTAAPHARVTFSNARETDVELSTTTCSVRLTVQHALTERQLLDSLHAQITKAMAIAAMEEESQRSEQERHQGAVDMLAALGSMPITPKFSVADLKITEE